MASTPTVRIPKGETVGFRGESQALRSRRVYHEASVHDVAAGLVAGVLALSSGAIQAGQRGGPTGQMDEIDPESPHDYRAVFYGGDGRRSGCMATARPS